MELFPGLILIATLLGVLLIGAWIVLPFAIIGTKPLLRDLLAEVRKTNELLRRWEDRPL
jgi:hypothetical protein